MKRWLVPRAGRSLNPRKPWPTVEQAFHKNNRLIVFVIVSQFYVNGLQNYLPHRIIGVVWFVVGTLAGIATIASERLIRKERRWNR